MAANTMSAVSTTSTRIARGVHIRNAVTICGNAANITYISPVANIVTMIDGVMMLAEVDRVTTQEMTGPMGATEGGIEGVGGPIDEVGGATDMVLPIMDDSINEPYANLWI